MSYQPKVALVHDDFTQSGGAENLFSTLANLFPEAPIYTSLVNWGKVPKSIDSNRINVSWMQKIPFSTYLYKLFLPLYPFAFESFDFSKYDLVISSSTRFAKSIISGPNSTHIAYLNSTPRFLWNPNAANQIIPRVMRPLLNIYIKYLKKWDYISSSRPDIFIANSSNVQSKIKKHYRKESYIIYPFANTNYFKIAKIHNWALKKQKYHLIVSRLVKWKKIDIAIEAVNLSKMNLKIVGVGPDKKRLQSVATGSNAEFLGKVSLKELFSLYNNSESVIVTQEEDFGIAAVEAQSCGVPVIAYKKGGVSEIIIDNKTGVLFSNQTAISLRDAIKKMGKLKYSKDTNRENALRFSRKKFEESFLEVIKKHAEQ